MYSTGSLIYEMNYRTAERERKRAHKHWSDLGPKQREHRWLHHVAAVFRPEATVVPSSKPRFA
jgi:hypothetical protein